MTSHSAIGASAVRWSGGSWQGIGAILVVIGLASCGPSKPETLRVTGVVVTDEGPLIDAEVMFIPIGSRPASGRTDSYGRFTLSTFSPGDGAVLGEHTVTVSKEVPANATSNGPYLEYSQVVPESYVRPQTSPLRAKVSKSGPKDFSFRLERAATIVP
jgi:hypothetical protein